MEDKRRFIKSNRNLLIILSLVSVLLTVYFMPASHKESYSYTVGKPWTYDVLIAPFSFSIAKSDEVWQVEADSVRAVFAPYFSRNATVAANALADLDRFYRDSLSKVVWEESYRIIRRRFEKVYEDGIISTSDEEILAGKDLFRVYEGNTSTFRKTSDVRSVRDAYRYVTDADVYAYDRYTLLQHNLENFIRPNIIYDDARSESDLENQLNEISHFRGMVVEGQKIIGQGEIVDEQKSLNKAYLEEVQEITVEDARKNASETEKKTTKRLKQEAKEYNKYLKAQRKVALPRRGRVRHRAGPEHRHRAARMGKRELGRRRRI